MVDEGDARAGLPARLGPREVRSKRFNAARFGRRGLDPDDVRRFLLRISTELANLRSELAGARAESRQLKAALRDWQIWYANRVQARSRIPANRSRRYDRD